MLASVFFSLQILRAFLVGSPDSSIASFQTLKSSGHSPYPEPVALKWEGRGLLTRAVQEAPWCSEHGPSEAFLGSNDLQTCYRAYWAGSKAPLVVNFIAAV